MVIILAITFLALVSIAISYYSLQQDKKREHMKEVQQSLAKGRVIYYAKPHDSSKES